MAGMQLLEQLMILIHNLCIASKPVSEITFEKWDGIL